MPIERMAAVLAEERAFDYIHRYYYGLCQHKQCAGDCKRHDIDRAGVIKDTNS